MGLAAPPKNPTTALGPKIILAPAHMWVNPALHDC